MIKLFEGKTIDLAVKNASRALNIPVEKISYEIVSMPTKGFLGIGAKSATIKIEIEEGPAAYISSYLRQVYEYLGIFDYKEKIEVEENGVINIQLDGEALNEFAEKNLDIVDSLQFLLAVTVNKKFDDHYKVTFNVNNYKEKAAVKVEDVAVKAAKQVQRTHKKVTLHPMSAYQRRIVHSKLQQFANITTFSIGTEPDRKVVIAYQYDNKKGNFEKDDKNNKNRNNRNSGNEGRNNFRNGQPRNKRPVSSKTESTPAVPQQPKVKQLYPRPADDEVQE